MKYFVILLLQVSAGLILVWAWGVDPKSIGMTKFLIGWGASTLILTEAVPFVRSKQGT